MPKGETAEQTPPKLPFGAPHVFVLAVIGGTDKTAVLRLTQSKTVIGRGGDAQISLEDEEVSKRHCLMRVEGSVCTLVDLGSLNGTTLNGRVLKGVSRRVKHMDEIQIGGTRMLFLSGRFRLPSPRS